MKSAPSSRSLRALDALAFFLADVQGGVGPFLAVYLQASRHWQPAAIGVAMSAAGLAAIAFQTPAGALIDRLRYKRELIVLGAALVAAGAIVTVHLTTLSQIAVLQTALGATGAFFPPAMAAISLGIVGKAAFDLRIGRNETFNHAGNVVTALLAGLLGYWLGQQFIFYFVAFASACSIAAVLAIRTPDIDFVRARAASRDDGAAKISPIVDLLRDRRLRTFALCVALFHFANAAMLPLIGQRLSLHDARASSLYIAVCIIGAQFVMMCIATPAARLAKRWGHKAVFLIGFSALPVRGVLYTLGNNPHFLIGVQLLDGIGAGIFGVMSVLVIADLTQGTGRFNLTQGAIATATGIGASLSNAVAGVVVQRAGYDAAFLVLAAIAMIALAIFALATPETNSGRKLSMLTPSLRSVAA